MQQQSPLALSDAAQGHGVVNLVVVLLYGREEPHHNGARDDDAFRHMHPPQGTSQFPYRGGGKGIRTGNDAADLEKPDANGRRARGGKKTTATATPPTTTEDAAPKTGRTARKTHDEVVAENNQKMADYMAERDKAIDAVADGREEIPFDEACAAADSVPQPELETPPRRTRKERKSAEQSEPVQDGTTNTDSESVTLDADTYFYVPADDNYVMKHKGDTVDLIVDGVEVMKVISKEEFGEGVKRLAQADNPKPENPVDGAMNPPEKGRRTRRSAAQAQPDNADAAADETPAVDEQPTGRTRRVRKTR